MKTLNKLLKDSFKRFIFCGLKKGNDKQLKKLEIEIKDLILENFDGCVYHKDDIVKIVREL